MQFKLSSPFQPTGDQPTAITQLTAGLVEGKQHQTLLSVTGSGQTFTVAIVIEQVQKPTLVIAHNKTLAAQLYQEFRDFFPNNAVSYFVSYYDYYQPEAYIPTTDTYIEKEATINDEIDKLRLATTTNLLTRPDVIVVASVSCIYNLGSPVEYGRYILKLMEGEIIARETLVLRLSNLQYDRSTAELRRGTFRLNGDIIQLWPAYEDKALRIDTLENKITKIDWIDPISGSIVVPPHSATAGTKEFVIYPAKHYVINPKTQQESFAEIETDLKKRVAELQNTGKTLEAYRLQQRITYDLDMLREIGFVNGIENYSRYFDGRKPGEPPYALLEYFHENARLFGDGSFLTVIDESHMTLPQIRGMYNGDQARKQTLIDYGFRLPSAKDNRPLTFHEFSQTIKQAIYVSATPNDYEISLSSNEVVEQLIRPTGLVDPEVELRQTTGQIEDLIIEILIRKQFGQRTLVTTLTKKMAEALTEYLNDHNKVTQLVSHFIERQKQEKDTPDSERIIRANEFIDGTQLGIGKIDPKFHTRAHLNPTSIDLEKINFPAVAYLHSDIETLERSDILDNLRRGEYDVVVGVNLLREGLDLPEVSLVAILDSDKEGFLRSATALIQTMGRAARHEQGLVIMYGDIMTKSMHKAISESSRRRTTQIAFNTEHGITPQGISKPLRERMLEKTEDTDGPYSYKKTKTKHLQGKDATAAATPNKPLLIQLSKREAVDINAVNPEALTPFDRKKLAQKLEKRMKQAANDLDFELAALLRDTVERLTTE